MKSYSDYREDVAQKKVDVEVLAEGDTIRIFFDYQAVSETRTENGKSVPHKYTVCENVDVKGGRSYADIVSAIVSDRYDSDQVQAIIANYTEATSEPSVLKLAQEKKEEYKKEYAAYQQWRAHAKEIAKKVESLIN